MLFLAIDLCGTLSLDKEIHRADRLKNSGTKAQRRVFMKGSSLLERENGSNEGRRILDRIGEVGIQIHFDDPNKGNDYGLWHGVYRRCISDPTIPGAYYIDMKIANLIGLLPFHGDIFQEICKDSWTTAASVLIEVEDKNITQPITDGFITIIPKKRAIVVWGKDPHDVLNFTLKYLGVTIEAMPEDLGGYKSFQLPNYSSVTPLTLGDVVRNTLAHWRKKITEQKRGVGERWRSLGKILKNTFKKRG